MRAALLGLLLSFAAGIANAADTPQSVVGIWYGRGQPVDEREDFIDHFRADGSFVSFFRKYEKCGRGIYPPARPENCISEKFEFFYL